MRNLLRGHVYVIIAMMMVILTVIIVIIVVVKIILPAVAGGVVGVTAIRISRETVADAIIGTEWCSKF